MAGRWYPGITSPRDARKHAQERAFSRALKARSGEPVHCKTCQAPMPGDTDPAKSWFPCCSEPCHEASEAELTRRDEVAQARRRGIPVAQLRAEKAAGS